MSMGRVIAYEGMQREAELVLSSIGWVITRDPEKSTLYVQCRMPT